MAATYQRVKITERVVSTAQPAVVQGAPRERLYMDTLRPGFGLRVSASGEAKSFFAQSRVNGQLVRDTFDPGAKLTVEQARKEAQRRLGLMASGVNTIAQRREDRVKARRARVRGFTLREAMALRAETLRAKGRSERTIAGDQYVIEKYLADWLDRPLAEITREEAKRKHGAITRAIAAGRYAKDEWRKRGEGFGLVTANRTMRAFRAVYNRALRQHPELPACPTINVDWHPRAKRKTPIGLDELSALHERIMALGSGVRRDWWRVALFTGLRRTSVCEIRWADVDLEAAVLHVPRPKGGEERAFDLPLSRHLVDLLRARLEENATLTDGSAWVFPAESESGHVEEPREDTLNISPHDCRRIFVTAAEACDVSPYAIKLIVNHALPKSDVTAGYVSVDVERLRVPMEQITARLRTLLEGKPAPVVEIGPRRERKAS